MLETCDGLRSLADTCALDPPPILPVPDSLTGLFPNASVLVLVSSEALDRNDLGVEGFIEGGL